MNRKRVQRVMRAHGLLVPQRRIPRGEHAGRIETSRSDEVWATDLSKIATREGWLWIVGVIDCHDRDLIGHRYGIYSPKSWETRPVSVDLATADDSAMRRSSIVPIAAASAAGSWRAMSGSSACQRATR